MRNTFDYADIIEEVMETGLGDTATADDVITARRSIHLLLVDWSAKQYNTWRVQTRDFAIPGVAAPIQLPVNIDDIMIAKTVVDNTDETPMTRMSEAQYAALTDKTIIGRPTQFLLRRTEPPQLFVYPVGRSGGETIRLTYVERPEAFDRNRNSVDAPDRWIKALILGAAASLVRKRPNRFMTSAGYSTAEQRYQSLQSDYGVALAEALVNDRQRTGFRLRI
jgi:hypothetical protein